MTGFLDRDRASQLMAEAGLDALVLSEPEAFRYATGENPGPAALFRRAGAAFALVPRDVGLPMGVVIADFSAAPFRGRSDVVLKEHPAWIESVAIDPADPGPLEGRIEAGLAGLGRPPGYARPATFDLALAAAALGTLLAEFGLSRSAVGFDLDFVPAADFAALEKLLPDVSIRQGSPVLDRLRAVKAPAEIALLERGIRHIEAGLAHMQAKGRTWQFRPAAGRPVSRRGGFTARRWPCRDDRRISVARPVPGARPAGGVRRSAEVRHGVPGRRLRRRHVAQLRLRRAVEGHRPPARDRRARLRGRAGRC